MATHQRIDITIPKGMKERAQELRINISQACTNGLRQAIEETETTLIVIIGNEGKK